MQQAQSACSPSPQSGPYPVQDAESTTVPHPPPPPHTHTPHSAWYPADAHDAESTTTQELGALKLLVAKLGVLRDSKIREFASTSDWREAIRIQQELSEIEEQVCHGGVPSQRREA